MLSFGQTGLGSPHSSLSGRPAPPRTRYRGLGRHTLSASRRAKPHPHPPTTDSRRRTVRVRVMLHTTPDLNHRSLNPTQGLPLQRQLMHDALNTTERRSALERLTATGTSGATGLTVVVRS